MTDHAGVKVALLYGAGWEIKVDNTPLEEAILPVGEASVMWGAYRPQVLTIERGGRVAMEARLTQTTFSAEHCLELAEDLRRLEAERGRST